MQTFVYVCIRFDWKIAAAKGFVYGEVKTDRRKLQDAFDQVIGSTRHNTPQGR